VSDAEVLERAEKNCLFLLLSFLSPKRSELWIGALSPIPAAGTVSRILIPSFFFLLSPCPALGSSPFSCSRGADTDWSGFSISLFFFLRPARPGVLQKTNLGTHRQFCAMHRVLFLHFLFFHTEIGSLKKEVNQIWGRFSLPFLPLFFLSSRPTSTWENAKRDIKMAPCLASFFPPLFFPFFICTFWRVSNEISKQMNGVLSFFLTPFSPFSSPFPRPRTIVEIINDINGLLPKSSGFFILSLFFSSCSSAT